jgi:hypothetical protein
MVPMASAEPTLSFEIDFEQDGVFETGGAYYMQPGQTVMVDIYFSVTEEGVIGGGFDLAWDDPGQLSAGALMFIFPPFVDTGLSEIIPGHVKVEAFAFPPGTVIGPGENFKFITFALTCTELGLSALTLFDFNAETAQWVTSPGGITLDEQLAGGIFLANVNNVPIPGTVLLLGSGLLGLLGIRRRMSN